MQDAYEALRVFEILAIEEKHRVTAETCEKVLENLGSSSSSLQDLFYALKVNGILKCKVNGEVFKVLIFFINYYLVAAVGVFLNGVSKINNDIFTFKK